MSNSDDALAALEKRANHFLNATKNVIGSPTEYDQAMHTLLDIIRDQRDALALLKSRHRQESAPLPPVKCKTCNDWGKVGGPVTCGDGDVDYVEGPCPDCGQQQESAEPVAVVGPDGFVETTQYGHRALMKGDKLYAERQQTEQTECTRSHPHELMSPMCELRTEIARLNNKLANLVPSPDRCKHGVWAADRCEKCVAETEQMAWRLTADEIFAVIKHGDAEHQRWLRNKLDELFAPPTAETQNGKTRIVPSMPLKDLK